MKIKHLVTAGAVCLLVACSDSPAPEAEEDAPADAAAATNPLLDDWDTPFGVPPFDRIESEDYLPAVRQAMAMHNAEIDAIIANVEAPRSRIRSRRSKSAAAC